MVRASIIILSACFLVAAVTAYLQYREKETALAESATRGVRIVALEGKVSELSAERESNLTRIQQVSMEVESLKGDLAERERVIEEQKNALKEMGSFKASLEEMRANNVVDEDWRMAIEEQAKLVSFLSEKLKDKGMTVYRQDPYVVVQIPQATFDFGSSRTSPNLIEGLKVVAEVFNAYKGTYLMAVEGHTDNTPMKKGGRYDSNWELGAARSNRVVQTLIGLGVDEKNIAMVSRSQFLPVNEHSIPTADEENRRIELVFAPRRVVVKEHPEYIPQTLE